MLNRFYSWAMPVALFVLSLTLYLRTLAPSVAALFNDSLEFQLVGYQLGIAHPTGYPLYTLLLKLFTLLPFGDVAYRANLSSAFFAALAVALVYLVTHRLTRAAIPSSVAALLFAISPVFWSQAVIAEVYALNALFVSTLLYLALQWHKATKNTGSQGVSEELGENPSSPSPSFPPIFLFSSISFLSFIYGLSLTHHRTMLLLGLALAAFLLPSLASRPTPHASRFTHPASRLSHLTSRIILPFLLPLSLYLYIPLRGLSTTSLDGTYRNTLPDFLAWITASQYTAFIGDNPLSQTRTGEFFLQLYGDQFGWLGIGFATVGLATLVRRPRHLALLALSLLAYPVFIAIYRVADPAVFLIPSFLVIAVLIGVGLDAIERAAHRWPGIPRAAVWLALAAFSLGPMLARWPETYAQTDLSQASEVRAYGLDILRQPLEERAVIVGILGEMTLVRYLQQTEGLRPDITTIHADRDAERLDTIADQVRTGRAVYTTRPLTGLAERFSLAAVGPLIRVLPSPSIERPAGLLHSLGPLTLVHSEIALDREAMRVTLYWQAANRLSDDLKVSLKLWDAQGNLFGQRDARPVHDAYPTLNWRAGEVVRDVYDVPIYPGHAAGTYRLMLTVYRAGDGMVVGEAEIGRVELLAGRGSPPRAARAIAQPIEVDFGYVELLGYSIGSRELKPGDSPRIVTLWRGQPEEALAARVWLEDISGGRWGVYETPLKFSESDQLGRVWLRHHAPARTPAGVYRLRLKPVRAGVPLLSRQWNLIPFPQTVEMGTVEVVSRPRSFDVPSLPYPVGARFQSIELLGYDLGPIVRPGDTLQLTLYWRALAETDTSYTVFVHLLDSTGIRAQRDQIPGTGAFPTTGWIAGEVLRDEYRLAIPTDVTAYRLTIGLYDAATGQRLAAVDAAGQPLGDHITLAGTKP